MQLNPEKLNSLAAEWDPFPILEEANRTAGMGSNFVTQPPIPGTTQAPMPGQGTGEMNYAAMLGGGQPQAQGAAPLPAGAMAGLMPQQPHFQPHPAPATAPRPVPQIQLPGAPPRHNPVPTMHQILYGGGR